jgi:hypothetical protein
MRSRRTNDDRVRNFMAQLRDARAFGASRFGK